MYGLQRMQQPKFRLVESSQHVTLIPMKAVVDIQSQILQIYWREVQIEWLGLFSTELLLQVPTHSGKALV